MIEATTSLQAPEPCLPGFEPPAPAPEALPAPSCDRMEFTGVLVRAAEVRTKPVGDGTHALPVVCLDLHQVGPGLHLVHAEQIFTEATRKQAEALAASLPKGARVTVRTPLLGIRISLPHVEHCQPLERSPN